MNPLHSLGSKTCAAPEGCDVRTLCARSFADGKNSALGSGKSYRILSHRECRPLSDYLTKWAKTRCENVASPDSLNRMEESARALRTRESAWEYVSASW